MALEELPALIYSARSHGIDVNLYAPGTATFAQPQTGAVTIEQQTRYPFDGSINLRLTLEHTTRFALRLRIPSWAKNATIRINGERAAIDVRPGEYATLDRKWRSGDSVALDLPMPPQVHYRRHRNVQESRAPDGSPVQQEVLRQDYLAITRGPLVYATGLIDGYKTEESLLLAQGPSEQWLQVESASYKEEGPVIVLGPERRAPLAFVPYYRAGGRIDGAWRLTWMPLAPEPRP